MVTVYPDKYTLTRAESLFLAKKKWDETIYCGMKMENRNVTFPQTQTILQGVNIGSVSLDTITAILNMRDAWKYCLSSIDEELTLPLLCTMNGLVSRNESLEWGVLRTGNIGISGVHWTPPLPEQKRTETELGSILAKAESSTEKALDIFLWGTRSPLFGDGNKRTSLLAANKILVGNGKGLLSIKEDNMAVFNGLLSAWYESGAGEELKAFLYEKAIYGIG
ncbi:Fic family protein [Breznakiellaceae bacterium SP9]